MKNTKHIILSIIFSIFLIMVGIFVCGCQNDYKECKSIAIINNSYYKVYATATEDETNYMYYYKSIKVKETEDTYIVILTDWKTGTKEEFTFYKNKCIVIVNY